MTMKPTVIGKIEETPEGINLFVAGCDPDAEPVFMPWDEVNANSIFKRLDNYGDYQVAVMHNYEMYFVSVRWTDDGPEVDAYSEDSLSQRWENIVNADGLSEYT